MENGVSAEVLELPIWTETSSDRNTSVVLLTYPCSSVKVWGRNDEDILTVNGLYLYSAFLTSDRSKHLTILPNIHPFMHTFTHRHRSQPSKVTASSSGAGLLRVTSTLARRSRGSN